ncbi:MAG: hypothetical protein Q3990_09620, partial [Desulfovibrionaceae bacterium]|nr:hypothetical protein [Desulfovibrionaceae bacterium]
KKFSSPKGNHIVTVFIFGIKLFSVQNDFFLARSCKMIIADKKKASGPSRHGISVMDEPDTASM